MSHDSFRAIWFGINEVSHLTEDIAFCGFYLIKKNLNTKAMYVHSNKRAKRQILYGVKSSAIVAHRGNHLSPLWCYFKPILRPRLNLGCATLGLPTAARTPSESSGLPGSPARSPKRSAAGGVGRSRVCSGRCRPSRVLAHLQPSSPAPDSRARAPTCSPAKYTAAPP